ncbi:NAD kinase [Robiginitomaculum antarcticum]|uniref:NAD kinase n=1 Tax=Robiginitomaculum antarcticum TaxID=437507 RepID=UPI00036F000A|nr:NAD kinase [Robiginitomaculum antarcticum]
MSKPYRHIRFLASNKPDAQAALSRLIARYGQADAGDADVFVAVGGDGFLLGTLHRHIDYVRAGTPIYGMNYGTIGFLMNAFEEDNLHERLDKAEAAIVRPLLMRASGEHGDVQALAINEVSLIRQTRQTAHLKIKVDGRSRLERLIADGVLVATAAGSTAYNLSAHGPVLPLGADILALTPISAFRPRRWRGALLDIDAHVEFEILNPEKRPVSVTADDQEFRDIHHVSVKTAHDIELKLLFDEGHELDEKILREQFST